MGEQIRINILEKFMHPSICYQLCDMVLTSSREALCKVFGMAELQECIEDFKYASSPKPPEVSHRLWDLTKETFFANAYYCCFSNNGDDEKAQKELREFEKKMTTLREVPTYGNLDGSHRKAEEAKATRDDNQEERNRKEE